MDGKSDSAIELIDKGGKQKNDANDMARLGKTPVLKVLSTSIGSSSALTMLQRNFGFMSILGFSCTVLITWEGFLI